MTIEQIERAVENLSTQDLFSFSGWFEAYLESKWDKQLEEDILAGRLDQAGARADQDFEAGRCTAL